MLLIFLSVSKEVLHTTQAHQFQCQAVSIGLFSIFCVWVATSCTIRLVASRAPLSRMDYLKRLAFSFGLHPTDMFLLINCSGVSSLWASSSFHTKSTSVGFVFTHLIRSFVIFIMSLSFPPIPLLVSRSFLPTTISLCFAPSFLCFATHSLFARILLTERCCLRFFNNALSSSPSTN